MIAAYHSFLLVDSLALLTRFFLCYPSQKLQPYFHLNLYLLLYNVHTKIRELPLCKTLILFISWGYSLIIYRSHIAKTYSSVYSYYYLHSNYATFQVWNKIPVLMFGAFYVIKIEIFLAFIVFLTQWFLNCRARFYIESPWKQVLTSKERFKLVNFMVPIYKVGHTNYETRFSHEVICDIYD